ncbi:hypothetical protein GCM10028803_11330 [Larkinella knui]|uniref:T9SS C-terminal target domain-containing protein n=1 Tax=Larkinella knui TaxID=2025310 RepID=A0A3P1CC59_9BACT|nr:T9SS type A sorting domain-containing protein [Larkinella knui]RRB10901.1 T9SS C-terminal target domain-containing protein [Larkinella knui]
MRKIAAFLLIFSSLPVLGTHLIGGYIQVRNVAASTYEITVKLYMESSGAGQQETSVLVCLNDGAEPVSVARTSSRLLKGGILLNEYRITHTYNGNGTGSRTISAFPSNRTQSRNIPNALSTLFYIKTTFVSTQSNTTPVFQDFDSRLTGTVNQKAEYNFLATDSEGDSVVHYLVRPQTGACNRGSLPIAGYAFPNDVTRRGTFKIGRQDGRLVWDSPTETGTYGFALAAEEWRKGQRISETVFDMVTLIADGGTPGTVPPYEPAVERELLTGINDHIDDRDLSVTVYPSPSQNRFLVVLKSSKPTTATFQLLDSQGRILQEVAAGKAALEHEQAIGNEQLAPGLYVIRTSARGRVYSNKVIKR